MTFRMNAGVPFAIIQTVPSEYSDGKDEPYSPVPTVVEVISSSSWDDLVTPSSSSLPHHIKQSQVLMHRVTAELQIQLENVQEPQHSLLDIHQPSNPS